MKKSLIALAALGSIASVAQAQSSVTMFGVVDLNVRYVKNDETTYSLGQDGMASSRLGFRGVEDLGGGLKASFWLEAALGPDTGRGSASFGNGTTTVAPAGWRQRDERELVPVPAPFDGQPVQPVGRVAPRP